MNIFLCRALRGNGKNGKVILVTNVFWIEGSPARVLEKIVEHGITRDNVETIMG